MANELQGKTIALLVSPKGSEQVEFEKPKQAVEGAGGSVTIISSETGSAQLVNNDLESGDSVQVDKTFADVSAADFDGLIIPGGTVGADTLRANKDAVSLIRSFFEQAKPVAAICHAPWTLIEADVVKGRKLTSYNSLETDLRNAGANWVDQEVVTDQGLVTSRNPDDLAAFCAKLVEEFAEGKHEQQAQSV